MGEGMNKKVSKPKKKKKKKILTPDEKKQRKLQRKFTSDIKNVFCKTGFQHYKTHNQEFNFKGRKGEIDNIFIYENIIVLCEETCTTKPKEHLFNKKIIFDLINDHSVEFVDYLKLQFPLIKKAVTKKVYVSSEYTILIVYCSRYDIEPQHKYQLPNVKFFDYAFLIYFYHFLKVIGLSARFELYKFLELEYDNIGISVAKNKKQYIGFLLPQAFSSFPAEYKIVTFYIDPATLLERV